MLVKTKEAKAKLTKALSKALGGRKKYLTRKNFDSTMFGIGGASGLASLSIVGRNASKKKALEKTAARGEIGYQALKLLGASKKAKSYKKGAIAFGDKLSKVYQTKIPYTPKSRLSPDRIKSLSKSLGDDPLGSLGAAIGGSAGFLGGLVSNPIPGVSIVTGKIGANLGRKLDSGLTHVLNELNFVKNRSKAIKALKAEMAETAKKVRASAG